jgi:hypothetical protein
MRAADQRRRGLGVQALKARLLVHDATIHPNGIVMPGRSAGHPRICVVITREGG